MFHLMTRQIYEVDLVEVVLISVPACKVFISYPQLLLRRNKKSVFVW
jgi:hypothetical protein